MKTKEATKKILKTKTKQTVNSHHNEVKFVESKQINISNGPLRINEFLNTNPSLWCIVWAFLWRFFILILTLYVSCILLITFISLIIANLFSFSV